LASAKLTSFGRYTFNLIYAQSQVSSSLPFHPARYVTSMVSSPRRGPRQGPLQSLYKRNASLHGLPVQQSKVQQVLRGAAMGWSWHLRS